MEKILSELIRVDLIENLDRTSTEIDRILKMMNGIQLGNLSSGAGENEPRAIKQGARKSEQKRKSLLNFEDYL